MRKAACKFGAVGLSAIMIFSFAGCGSSSKSSSSTASVSSTSEPKATETATPTPTEEVKDLSVVSASSEAESEKQEINGFDEGTTDYTYDMFTIPLPNYYVTSSSDNDSWFAETGQSVVMLGISSTTNTTELTDEKISSLMDTAPAEFLSGLSDDSIGLRFLGSDIKNKQKLTVAGYQAESFEAEGEMNYADAPDISSVQSKSVIIFAPNANKTYYVSLLQSNNSKYSYLQDFDKIIENITVADTSSVSSSSSTDSGEVTPELKEFLDSYEAFMNEYVEFLKQYQANPTDATLISEYTQYMTKLLELEQKANEYQSSESQMSTADYNYYIDSMARIEKKLIEAQSYTTTG